MSSRVGRRGHSQAFRASVVSAILAGGQVRAVATLYGVSKASIWLWCKSAGVLKVKGLPPECHPQEKHFGRGLCAACYKREWSQNGNVHRPMRRAA